MDNASNNWGVMYFDELHTYHTEEVSSEYKLAVNQLADLTEANEVLETVITEQGDYTAKTYEVYANAVNTAKDAAESKRASLAGTYAVTAAHALNVRDGAGTNAKILVTIPNGTKVKCYGYYTQNGETTWLYVQFTYEETTYTGFVSTRYLEKR